MRKLYYLIITVFFISCNSEETSVSNKRVKIEDIDLFKKARNECDKLVIKQYQTNDSIDVTEDLTKVIWSDSITKLNKIKQFDSLFYKVKDMGYFSYPSTQFKVFLNKGNSNILTYNVITIDSNNVAIFSDGSFQTSYSVSLDKWNEFLRIK